MVFLLRCDDCADLGKGAGQSLRVQLPLWKGQSNKQWFKLQAFGLSPGKLRSIPAPMTSDPSATMNLVVRQTEVDTGHEEMPTQDAFLLRGGSGAGAAQRGLRDPWGCDEVMWSLARTDDSQMQVSFWPTLSLRQLRYISQAHFPICKRKVEIPSRWLFRLRRNLEPGSTNFSVKGHMASVTRIQLCRPSMKTVIEDV